MQEGPWGDGYPGFQNYTWIEGWSEKDGSAGQWSVRVSPHDTDVRFNNSLKISYFQIGNHEVGLNLEWNPETNAFRSCMNGGNWVE